MISDLARISLGDGARMAAIDVFPGREVLSPIRDARVTKARVLSRNVSSRHDAIGLLMDTGSTLFGSPDQKVAVCVNKTIRFRPLGDITIGDVLRGEVAGMPITIKVSGIVANPKETRLVGFRLDHDKNFVAEGVLCRS